MENITTQFYNKIDALTAFSENLPDAVSRSAVVDIAKQYLASLAEIFSHLTKELGELKTQLAEKTKEITLLSQSNAQLITERIQAAQELVNSGNRLIDLVTLSSKLIQARNQAEMFINKNLPEIFARMTNQAKLMGGCGLAAFIFGTTAHYYTDENSTYKKMFWITIQGAGLLAIGTAIGSSLAVNNLLRTQSAFVRAI